MKKTITIEGEARHSLNRLGFHVPPLELEKFPKNAVTPIQISFDVIEDREALITESQFEEALKDFIERHRNSTFRDVIYYGDFKHKLFGDPDQPIPDTKSLSIENS